MDQLQVDETYTKKQLESLGLTPDPKYSIGRIARLDYQQDGSPLHGALYCVIQSVDVVLHQTPRIITLGVSAEKIRGFPLKAIWNDGGNCWRLQAECKYRGRIHFKASLDLCGFQLVDTINSYVSKFARPPVS